MKRFRFLWLLFIPGIAWAAGAGISTWTAMTDSGVLADDDLFAITNTSGSGTTAGDSEKITFAQLKTNLLGGEYIETDTDVNVTVTGENRLFLNNHASAITYTLPADVITITGSGKVFCFRNLVAQAMTVDLNISDYFNYDTDGVMTAGEHLISTGAIGEFICVSGFNDGSNDYWITWGTSGTWAQETP